MSRDNDNSGFGCSVFLIVFFLFYLSVEVGNLTDKNKKLQKENDALKSEIEIAKKNIENNSKQIILEK